MYDEVSCGLTHAPSATAWAKSPALTTECHQVLESAGLALDSEEPIGQNPAPQELFELLDHKIRQWVAGVALNLLPKWQPVLLHDFVENCLFGLVALIGVLGCAGNFGHTHLQSPANICRTYLARLLERGGGFCPGLLFAPDVDAYDVSYWRRLRSASCWIWSRHTRARSG